MLTPHDDIRPAEARSSSPPDGAADERWMRDPIQRAMAAHRSGDGAGTAAALDALCEQARQASVPVERVIIMVKDLWYSDAGDRLPRGRPPSDQLARLISACIVAYYAA